MTNQVTIQPLSIDRIKAGEISFRPAFSPAVLDTGIDTDHPLLSDDLIHQGCFLDNGTCPGGGTTGCS